MPYRGTVKLGARVVPGHFVQTHARPDLHGRMPAEIVMHEAFTGTVMAVTHDRWFTAGFDRYLVFAADGHVHETDEPVWDERRVDRPR